MKLVERAALKERVDLSSPRVLRVVAPPGYGKTIVARQLQGSYRRVAVCDCLGVDEPLGLVKRLLRSLAAWSDSGAEGLLMAATCSDNDLAFWTRALEQAWRCDDAAALLIIENAEALNRSVALRAPLAELFASPRPGVRVIVCSRERVPIRFGRFATPDEIMLIHSEDLRFSRAEIDELSNGLPNRGEFVWNLSRGWPMAAQLLLRLLDASPAATYADLQQKGSLDDLYDFLAAEVLSGLTATELDVLEALAVIPNAAIADLKRLDLTQDLDDALACLLAKTPFVSRSPAGDYLVHPLLQGMLQYNPGGKRDAIVRTLAERSVLYGEHVRAAELFADLGDQEACARALDVAPLFTGTPSPRSVDLILELDRATLSRHPLLWCTSVMMSRGFGIDKFEWLHEAQRFWDALGPDADPALRSSIFGTLLNALTNVGDFAGADRLCDDFEAGLSSDALAIAAESIAFWRGVRAVISDRATDLKSLEEPIAGLLANDVTRALWGYEIAAKFHRVNGDRSRERSTLATSVETAIHTQLPMAICATSADAAFASWFAGEDALSISYQHVLERHVTVGTSGGCRPILDVIAGRYDSIRLDNAKKKVITFAHVMAYAGTSDPALQRSLALQAVIAADQSHRPFEQILARVILTNAFPERDEQIASEIAAIGAEVAPERLRTDAVRLGRGQTEGTIFEALADRLRSKPRRLGTSPSTLQLSLASGRLERHGGPLALSKRELELLAYLTMNRPFVTADKIALHVWDDAPGGQNSLKVCVSRLRKRLGAGVIQSSVGGYMATLDVETDIACCERALREARDAVNAADLERVDLNILTMWLKNTATGFPSSLLDRPWFSEYLTSLQLKLVDVMLLFGRGALRSNRYDLALRAAESLLEIDPCDEFATEIAIRSTVAHEDLSAARLHYNRYVRALRSNLDADPADHLASLLSANWSIGINNPAPNEPPAMHLVQPTPASNVKGSRLATRGRESPTNIPKSRPSR